MVWVYRISIICTLSILMASAVFGESEDQKSKLEAESLGLIKRFAQSLQSELVTTLKSEGPVQAIDVCAQKAPLIASELSAQHGLSVRRVSQKTRNSLNEPDSWELMTLQRFEQAKQEGRELSEISHGEVVDEQGVRYWRYMKAIGVQSQCLMCHGGSDQISPEVTAILKDRYPYDRATGYQAGELRGAFSLKKRLLSDE